MEEWILQIPRTNALSSNAKKEPVAFDSFEVPRDLQDSWAGLISVL